MVLEESSRRGRRDGRQRWARADRYSEMSQIRWVSEWINNPPNDTNWVRYWLPPLGHVVTSSRNVRGDVLAGHVLAIWKINFSPPSSASLWSVPNLWDLWPRKVCDIEFLSQWLSAVPGMVPCCGAWSIWGKSKKVFVKLVIIFNRKKYFRFCHLCLSSLHLTLWK